MLQFNRLVPIAVVSVLGFVALACGSTAAKPASPAAYPQAPISYAVSAGNADHFHGSQSQTQPAVSISGEGRASAPPDVARLRVSLNVPAPTAAQARNDGKRVISDLLETLKESGVDGQDIETRSFSISPITKRDDETGESEVVEYQLRNVSEITLRDVNRVGDLIDQLASDLGDAARISNITLAIEDPTEIQRRAREMAMLDAHARAQQLAELSGVALGPPISISEGSDRDPGGLISKEVLIAPVEEGLSSVPVGDLEAVVSVFATYSLIAP
jgi:uncharacterized protein YggE